MRKTQGESRARYEAGLDRAHRNLYWAGTRAEEMGDASAAHHCFRMQSEILELMNDSLNGTRRKPPEGAQPAVRIRKPGGGDVIR